MPVDELVLHAIHGGINLQVVSSGQAIGLAMVGVDCTRPRHAHIKG